MQNKVVIATLGLIQEIDKKGLSLPDELQLSHTVAGFQNTHFRLIFPSSSAVSLLSSSLIIALLLY